MKCSIRYSVNSSFEATYSVYIEFSADVEEPAEANVEWRASKMDPFKAGTKMLDADLIRTLNKQMQSLTIEAIPEFTAGLDGSEHNLTFECGFNKVAYQWWSQLPQAWKSFQPLVTTLEGIVKQHAQNEHGNR